SRHQPVFLDQQWVFVFQRLDRQVRGVRHNAIGYRYGRVGRGRRQFEMPRRAGRLVHGDEIGEGAADIDADPDHSSSSRRVRAVSPPLRVNGLWISTPPSVLPSAISSVRISVQPDSAAVATSSASQYDARPATALASAVRIALAVTATERKNASQSSTCAAAAAGGMIRLRVTAA